MMNIGEEVIALLPRLRRLAIALTGSRHSADDLVQSACERAIASASSWTPGTRLDAWMFRILRNLWIDSARRRRTEGFVIDIADRLDLAAPHGPEAAESRLTLQHVRQAIPKLPADQREVLALVCIDEMPYRAAADVLGVPIGTVMSRLCRARQRLAELTGYDYNRRRSGRSVAR